MTDNVFQNVSGIHVSVRIRPLSQQEINSGRQVCCQSIGDSTVVISKEGDSSAYLKSQTSSIHEYAFDAVFDPTSTQEDVYNKSAKPYVNKAIIGENVTIFAYGTTGAGKTHTMFGNTRMDSTSNIAGGGVIPQTIHDLFTQINHLHEENRCSTTTNDIDGSINLLNDESQPPPLEQQSWDVSFSYLEVYNEQVCDLLEPSINGKDLPLREDPTKGIVHVVGLTEFPVKNYDEVIELLMKGQLNRKTEATKANAVSSRSHAIIQFTIVRTKVNHAGQKTFIESKLSLIDLAGSERASVTQSTGMRLQEGSNINKSLLALANCISALAERSSSEDKNNVLRSPSARKSIKVKYRDSKLTHLLKGSLEGNCNLVMIANVNPADDTYDDTYHTLCYANRAKNLKVNPLIREQFEEITADKQLKLLEENNLLKSKIAELQATVQMLMEHRDRSSIGSSSIESCSRRSTIDSISSSTSYNQTNAVLLPQNAREIKSTRGNSSNSIKRNSSSNNSIASMKESNSSIASKKIRKRQSITGEKDRTMNHNMPPPTILPSKYSMEESYQNDMINSSIPIVNSTPTDLQTSCCHTMNSNLVAVVGDAITNVLEESSSSRKRTSLSLSEPTDIVDTPLSRSDLSNKENELGNYVYPASPRFNHPNKQYNQTNNNHLLLTQSSQSQSQQPIKTRRIIANENTVEPSRTMNIVRSERCDSIDGFAMIANEKQHRLSKETNHRESNCSELTMEDNQSIGKFSFGTITVDPRDRNLSLDIPLKEGNRNHLEISNPNDQKKPKFLTRFLCGINQLKKIRKK